MNFKLFINILLVLSLVMGCKKSKIDNGKFKGTLNGEKWKPEVKIRGSDRSCMSLDFEISSLTRLKESGSVFIPTEVGLFNFWSDGNYNQCNERFSSFYVYFDPEDQDVILTDLVLDTVHATTEGAFIDILEVNEEMLKGEIYLPLANYQDNSSNEFDEFGNPNKMLIEGELTVYFNQ